MARFSAPKAGVLLGLVALATVAPSSEAFCGFLKNNGNTPARGAGPLSAKVCTLYNAPISPPSTHTPHLSSMLVVPHQLMHASLSHPKASVFDFSVKDAQGKDVSLREYADKKALLIVNVASK